MNRFRLLEAAPRKEFALYTGLPETVIRPQIDEALAQGISRNVRNTGITEHGKAVLKLPS